MTAKQYLEQALNILNKIKVRETMIAEKYSASEYKGINYDSTGSHGSAVNSTENAYISAADFELRVRKEIADLNVQLNSIKAMILKVEDGVQGRILTLRFIEGKEFDDIAEEIGYSERQMFRHYNIALDKISEMIKDGSECH